MAKNIISLTKEGVLEVNSILEDYMSDPGYVKKRQSNRVLVVARSKGRRKRLQGA